MEFGRRGASGLILYGYGDGFSAYQNLIEKWGVWIIIAKSLTPIPFKIMAVAAGVAGMSPSAFLASATIGRALHFAIVATLIALWGGRVMDLVSRYGRVLAVFSVLLLLGLAVAYHLR
jgi:membrane protein DedA with SNARE-associated domain